MAGNDDVILVELQQKVLAEFVKPSATEQIVKGSSISILNELKSKVNNSGAAGNPKKKKPNTVFIPKVIEEMPEKLRRECYEPKLVSFGPYHHGKHHLQRGEELKLKLAAAYILESGKTVDYFYGVTNSIKNVKGCYDEESTKKYSDEEFSMMMLVDGCSLLYYIFCVCTGWLEEEFNIRYQDLSLLQQDALLLENQLPFRLLLTKLMEPDSSFWMYMCHKFIRMHKLSPQEKMPLFSIVDEVLIDLQPQGSGKPADDDKPFHLLDLFRRNILGDEGRSSRTHRGEQPSKGGRKFDKKTVQAAMRGDFLSFTNVKELTARGIRIKRSHTGHLTDISFTPYCITACLRLPPITIDKSTKAIFLNMMAHEMSSDVPHDFISYLRFLDSLIDHADDVKELQSVRVLQNNLGTHEEVAQFFNTVSANLESNFYAYKEVKEKIREHLESYYKSKLKRWMTECLDIYCRSPWTIIAWVGAFLALFFTAVQTYFCVIPRRPTE